MLTQDNYVRSRLVEVGWRFGKKYGGHIAGELVMSVIMNRVRVGWGSVLQVIDSLPKFMAEENLPPLEHPPIWEPAFVKLLHAVEGIYDGSVPDKSKGALYWGDLQSIERPWFRDNIIAPRKEGSGLPEHPRVVDMNSLAFFQ